MNDWWQKEKYVIIHGQPRRFRQIKWLVILSLAVLLFFWKGWLVVVLAFLLLALFGVALHFLLRWKTQGWTKDWGKIKKIETPFDK